MGVALVALILIGDDATVSPGRGEGPPPVVFRMPIDAEGSIDLSELVGTLAERTGVRIERPRTPLRLPVRGLSGALARTMISEVLGAGVSWTLEADCLVLTLDPAVVAESRRAAWQRQLAELAERVRREAALQRTYFGMKALASYRPNDPKRPTVLLVHGMNSSSGGFVHMAPLLERAGFGVVVYDFPDNRDLDESAPRFVRDWSDFRSRVGERRPWAIVAHSMGGLLARWYVEGDDYGDDVSDLILIGPPNHGSALARAQRLIQVLRNVQGINGRYVGVLSDLGDGLGAAADDMRPGSAFLEALNGRPRRAGVRYRILAGDRGFLSAEGRARAEAQLAAAGRVAGGIGRLARLATGDLPTLLDELAEGTGDGVVALASTRLDGADEPVVIHANHVELIRGPALYPDPGPVACMPWVLAWLGVAEPARVLGTDAASVNLGRPLEPTSAPRAAQGTRP
jgi:pimeloyl-ACP methyl ester carboxylesterase